MARSPRGQLKGKHSRRREGGAALVEMAIVTPLLIILLLGIAEFGWAIGQQLDLRSKTREITRIAQVDGTVADMQGRLCANDLVKKDNIVSAQRSGGNNPGGTITVNVVANVEQITSLFSLFWGANPQITSVASGRIEQPITNWSTPNLSGAPDPCP